jgi:ribosome-binding protein aMBF1 (putative translation factor)
MITPIKLARLNSGMLQWQLAQQIGIGNTRLSKYETGREEAPPEIIAKIEEVLGVRIKKAKP